VSTILIVNVSSPKIPEIPSLEIEEIRESFSFADSQFSAKISLVYLQLYGKD